MTEQRSVVVFDLGGVLIDWNPRYLYRKLFPGDEKAMETFLATVCTPSWNLEQDSGRSFAEGCTLLKATHPEHSDLIDAWFTRYGEMLAGEIPGTVDILRELRSRSIPLYALSNWSAETFPIALQRFDFLRWFQGILLSGEARLIKPDPRIFALFLNRFEIDPQSAVYIDDSPANVTAAGQLGFHEIGFTDAPSLRKQLVRLGILEN